MAPWSPSSQQRGCCNAVDRDSERTLGELVARPGLVAGPIEILEAFHARELVRFDEQTRAPFSGIQWRKVPG